MKAEDASLRTESIRPLAWGAGVIALIVISYGVGMTRVNAEWPVLGQFGDMFGALNTLFSGLAFAGLTYALVLQRKELALQRLELSQTRQELMRQAEAQSQHAATALQAAEISAVGSLFQGYSQLIAGQRYGFVGGDNWESDFKRVRDRLIALLDAQARGVSPQATADTTATSDPGKSR